MKDKRITSFDGRQARLQYALLMGLYRLVFNRWLYGIFCRGLARFFPSDNSVILDLGLSRRFRIYLNDGYWTRFYLYHRSYEPEVAAVLDAGAGHAEVFCDLGANSGLWSVYAAPLVDKVIAVEAAAGTYARLLENVSDIENIDAKRAAIFSVSGELLQFVNVHNSHASGHLDLTSSADGAESMEQVETVSIDDLLAPGQAAIIKLDVEGAEIDAIKGANDAIKAGSVFVYEDHGSDAQSEVSAFLMNECRMRLYSIENGCNRIEDLDHLQRIKTDRFKGYNFLAGLEDSLLLTAIVENFAKPE